MKTQFQKIDDLNASLTVTITPEDYKEKVDKQLRDYRKNAKLPGFRPGMAPMGMIKKMVGKAIFAEEVNRIANDSLYEYLVENKINVLGKPLMSDDKEPIADFDKEGEFEFYFDLGLAPEFDLNVSDKDKITRYVLKVDEKEIDKEVDNLLRRYGSLEKIDKTETDQDSISGTLTELNEEGKAFEGGVEDKETRVLLEMVEDKKTKKALTGVQEGAEVEVDIFKLFKDNEQVIASTLGLPKEGVQDLNKTFLFKVTDLQRFKPAEENQEFYDKVFGEGAVKSAEEFRTKVEENLKSYYQGEAENMVDHEIQHLMQDKHKLSLPDGFLKRWLQQQYPDTYNNENIEERYDNESNALRYQLLNDKVVEEYKIEVNEEDMNQASMAFTAQRLREYGLPNPDVETLRYFEQQNREDQNYMNQVRDMVVNRKVTDQIKSMVTVKEKEVSVEKFYDIVKKHNEKHNH